MIETLLLKADSPEELELKAFTKMKDGWDLHGTVVTAHKFLVGQWIVKIAPSCEYRMVIADSMGELERDVISLLGEGYEFFGKTESWHNKMMQWMCLERLNIRAEQLAISRMVEAV